MKRAIALVVFGLVSALFIPMGDADEKSCASCTTKKCFNEIQKCATTDGCTEVMKCYSTCTEYKAAECIRNCAAGRINAAKPANDVIFCMAKNCSGECR